jgi:hypothetical protein
MGTPNDPGSPFTIDYSHSFGSGATAPTPPVISAGNLYALRLILARAVVLIEAPQPSHANLTEAVRLINSVYATLGPYT